MKVQAYQCDLCHVRMYPEKLFGIDWTQCGLVQIDAEATEHHICRNCVDGLMAIHRPPPVTEKDKTHGVDTSHMGSPCHVIRTDP